MWIDRHQHCGRYARPATRRQFLARAGGGLGLLALADLLRDPAGAAEDEPRASTAYPPRAPHFAPRAKSVIWLFMEGAPSAVDLFDPKPELDRSHGKRIAIDVFNGNPGPLMKSPFAFQRYGRCGAWVCEKYPNVARHVDDIAFVKSCFTESNDHVPALYQMNTGVARVGLPTAGAWVTYGLGSENRNLPGFVVLGNTQGIKGGPLNWGAGFLPTTYQGTLFRAQGSPILNLRRPKDVAGEDQRAQLELRGHGGPQLRTPFPATGCFCGRRRCPATVKAHHPFSRTCRAWVVGGPAATGEEVQRVAAGSRRRAEESTPGGGLPPQPSAISPAPFPKPPHGT